MNKHRIRTIILSVAGIVIWLVYLAIAYATKDKMVGDNGTVHIPIWYAILVLLMVSLVFIPLFHRINYHASLAKMKKVVFAVRFLLVVFYASLLISFVTTLFYL